MWHCTTQKDIPINSIVIQCRIREELEELPVLVVGVWFEPVVFFELDVRDREQFGVVRASAEDEVFRQVGIQVHPTYIDIQGEAYTHDGS
jgi:hypothetical protein